MIVASKISKNKTFHYKNCKYAANISPDNLIKFKDKDEARKAGFHHCSYCSRLSKYYLRNKASIDNYIKEHRLQMYIEDDTMYIENTFSAWKIIVIPGGYDLDLYHANTESYYKLQKKDGHIIHHYHHQKYKGDRNIISMLKYIIEHDEWKANDLNKYKKLPRKSKKQKKAYNKARKSAKRTEMRNLYNLMDKMKLSMEEEKKK